MYIYYTRSLSSFICSCKNFHCLSMKQFFVCNVEERIFVTVTAGEDIDS